jgi:hypothetical protein
MQQQPGQIGNLGPLPGFEARTGLLPAGVQPTQFQPTLTRGTIQPPAPFAGQQGQPTQPGFTPAFQAQPFQQQNLFQTVPFQQVRPLSPPRQAGPIQIPTVQPTQPNLFQTVPFHPAQPAGGFQQLPTRPLSPPRQTQPMGAWEGAWAKLEGRPLSPPRPTQNLFQTVPFHPAQPTQPARPFSPPRQTQPNLFQTVPFQPIQPTRPLSPPRQQLSPRQLTQPQGGFQAGRPTSPIPNAQMRQFRRLTQADVDAAGEDLIGSIVNQEVSQILQREVPMQETQIVTEHIVNASREAGVQNQGDFMRYIMGPGRTRLVAEISRHLPQYTTGAQTLLQQTQQVLQPQQQFQTVQPLRPASPPRPVQQPGFQQPAGNFNIRETLNRVFQPGLQMQPVNPNAPIPQTTADVIADYERRAVRFDPVAPGAFQLPIATAAAAGIFQTVQPAQPAGTFTPAFQVQPFTPAPFRLQPAQPAGTFTPAPFRAQPTTPAFQVQPAGTFTPAFQVQPAQPNQPFRLQPAQPAGTFTPALFKPQPTTPRTVGVGTFTPAPVRPQPTQPAQPAGTFQQLPTRPLSPTKQIQPFVLQPVQPTQPAGVFRLTQVNQPTGGGFTPAPYRPTPAVPAAGGFKPTGFQPISGFQLTNFQPQPARPLSPPRTTPAVPAVFPFPANPPLQQTGFKPTLPNLQDLTKGFTAGIVPTQQTNFAGLPEPFARTPPRSPRQLSPRPLSPQQLSPEEPLPVTNYFKLPTVAEYEAQKTVRPLSPPRAGSPVAGLVRPVPTGQLSPRPLSPGRQLSPQAPVGSPRLSPRPQSPVVAPIVPPLGSPRGLSPVGSPRLSPRFNPQIPAQPVQVSPTSPRLVPQSPRYPSPNAQIPIISPGPGPQQFQQQFSPRQLSPQLSPRQTQSPQGNECCICTEHKQVGAQQVCGKFVCTGCVGGLRKEECPACRGPLVASPGAAVGIQQREEEDRLHRDLRDALVAVYIGEFAGGAANTPEGGVTQQDHAGRYVDIFDNFLEQRPDLYRNPARVQEIFRTFVLFSRRGANMDLPLDQVYQKFFEVANNLANNPRLSGVQALRDYREQ